jgi:hypothetical protein
LVRDAILQNPWSLQFAAEELRADRGMVRLAVTTDGLALKFAEPELCADRDIVLWAVKNNPEAWVYASPKCRRDPEVRRVVGFYCKSIVDRHAENKAVAVPKRAAAMVLTWRQEQLFAGVCPADFGNSSADEPPAKRIGEAHRPRELIAEVGGDGTAALGQSSADEPSAKRAREAHRSREQTAEEGGDGPADLGHLFRG